MANEQGEPFVLDFPNGQRVEDILKKAQSNYSRAEIDAKMSSKANAEDVYSKSAVDTALDNKVDKVSGKGLSTNDYTTADKEKLAGIEAQANKTVVDDTLDDSSTNPVQNKVVKAALDNKADTADIPTVPITAIQKNGTNITPVGGTVNITVPTQASDINAATATQGDKADTAIQGIKVNNTTINPDVNKVVSITVPTTAAEVSALPDTTKYAAALSLTINSSTYVMTGQLKDQNGNNLGTAQTIDLPLESVVVGGSYNSQTKKVVLTLQNGNTIEFSVADLVSGLQTELSASNKLNPAYINYDSTHRAVSDTEKATWNGKQNALSAVQLAAVNSGINSTKVEQIETNINNISRDEAALVELVDSGAKNIADFTSTTKTIYTTATSHGVTITRNGDIFTISGTSDTRENIFFNIYYDGSTSTKMIPPGNWVALIEDYTGSVVKDIAVQPCVPAAHTKIYGIPFNFSLSGSESGNWLRVNLRPSTTYDGSFRLMICSQEDYAISPKFVPYARTNRELTTLSAEDRAALVELVDGGAKNLWDFKNAIYSGKSADASYTKTDTDITVASNGAWSAVTYKVNGLITGQRYVWSARISDYSVQSDTCRLRISSDVATQDHIASQKIEGNGNVNVEFVGRPELYFTYYINFSAASYQNTYKASENMICTKAARDISHEYQPYRPSYQELTKANRRKVYANTGDNTSYTFSNLYGLNESRFKYAIVCGGGTANNPALAMAWFVFIDNSGVVTTRKIIGDSPRTLTGSVSGTTLTLTSDSTMYGGLRLIWLS